MCMNEQEFICSHQEIALKFIFNNNEILNIRYISMKLQDFTLLSTLGYVLFNPERKLYLIFFDVGIRDHAKHKVYPNK